MPRATTCAPTDPHQFEADARESGKGNHWAVSETARSFWENRYLTADVEAVSWYEPEPRMSLALIDLSGATSQDAVIDIGGGASFLAQFLVERGFTDVTVLDASAEALGVARARWDGSGAVNWVAADLLQWQPARRWDLWHDRAVFHFLTDAADRAVYRQLLLRSVSPGGTAIVATFAHDGPASCSGLQVARYDPHALITELGDGFEPVASGRHLHHTPSGAEQPFVWAMIRKASSEAEASGTIDE